MNINVRFFIYDEEALGAERSEGTYEVCEPGDIVEVDEETFLACRHPIQYERHTMWANGVDRVCLTKMWRDVV